MSDQHHPSPQGQPSSADQGTAVGQNPVAEQFSELARSLQAHSDPNDTLAEVVAAAVSMIPGVEAGSISVVLARRRVMSQHPSGELPRLVDAIQEETGQGPCLDAAYEQQTVRVSDMATEQRWPKFARRAAEAGAGSMLSCQLYVKGDNLGALNLYSSRPNAFDDESEHVGLMLASHAAVAFANAQKLDQLNQKVAVRDLIGMAKGILMERYKITPERAFSVLIRVSQQSNRKLRDIAQELVDSGDLANPKPKPPAP